MGGENERDMLLLPRGDSNTHHNNNKNNKNNKNSNSSSSNNSSNNNSSNNNNNNNDYKSIATSTPSTAATLTTTATVRNRLKRHSTSSQPPWTRSIYARPNLALPTSYFLVGFSTALLATPISVYMIKEIGAQPEQQNVVAILMTLPWSFKLIYGFLSDSFPLFGYRRKSYFALGYLIYSVSMFMLGFIGKPTVAQLSICVFTATIGQIMADVMADTMIVERSRHEPEHKKGSAQATCYSIRFFGSIVGSLSAILAYNKSSWGWGLSFAQICMTCGLFPVALLFPTIPGLYELEGEVRSVSEQVNSIWEMVQLRAVWRPMAFIYIYNLFQIPNVAWASYLQLTLKFPSWFIGCIGFVGSLMTFAGIVIYKRYFFKSSWRNIYLWSSAATTFFSGLQLALIFQINERYFGISNYPFAMGDDVLQQFLAGIQFLPSCVMYMQLCPKGSEGATYSMLTTFGNIALAVAGTIGNLMVNIWDVSNGALQEWRLGGLWRLALLTSILPLLPLALIRLLPNSKEDQKKMQKSKAGSRFGGFCFLAVLGLSLMVVFVQSASTLWGELEGDNGSGGGGGEEVVKEGFTACHAPPFMQAARMFSLVK